VCAWQRIRQAGEIPFNFLRIGEFIFQSGRMSQGLAIARRQGVYCEVESERFEMNNPYTAFCIYEAVSSLLAA